MEVDSLISRLMRAALVGLLLLPALAHAGEEDPLILGIQVQAQDELISIRIRTTIRTYPMMSQAGQSESDSGLVIDFPGARLSPLVPSEVQPPPGCVRRVRIGAHPNKVRIVVEMDQDRDYEVHPFIFKDAFVLEIVPTSPAGTRDEREIREDPPVVR